MEVFFIFFLGGPPKIYLSVVAFKKEEEAK